MVRRKREYWIKLPGEAPHLLQAFRVDIDRAHDFAFGGGRTVATTSDSKPQRA